MQGNLVPVCAPERLHFCPMDALRKLFAEHPATVNETYGEHLLTAWSFGLRLIGAGLACMVHGLLPFLFVRTGSDTIKRLHARMVTERARPDRAHGTQVDAA